MAIPALALGALLLHPVLSGADTSRALQAQAPSIDPRVVGLVDAISEENLERLIERLASFETRNTLSSTDDPNRGIGAARAWMLEEMQGYSPRLQVSFDSYRIPAQGRIVNEVEIRNVLAILPGRSTRRVYVGGHYDSTARRELGDTTPEGTFDNFAPGANDDGSGTAITMELARVMAQSGIEFDATLVFIGFAGEEQGLVGARLHAQRARDNGWTIEALLSNDIAGNVYGGAGLIDGSSVRVFSEGPEDSPSRHLARYIKKAASTYVPWQRVRLIAREDRFGRGGDHTAFNQVGFTATRMTEARENYDRQHTIWDTPDGVHIPYLATNARVNVAAMASLALAPTAPNVNNEQGNPRLSRQPSGYDARMQWEASPGAVSYRVYWRDAWGPDWEYVVEVGNVTEFIMRDVSIDDFIFGVSAVGPDGHESMVSPYVRPPRADVEIEELPGG